MAGAQVASARKRQGDYAEGEAGEGTVGGGHQNWGGARVVERRREGVSVDGFGNWSDVGRYQKMSYYNDISTFPAADNCRQPKTTLLLHRRSATLNPSGVRWVKNELQGRHQVRTVTPSLAPRQELPTVDTTKTYHQKFWATNFLAIDPKGELLPLQHWLHYT
jgi:hypothetical protein